MKIGILGGGQLGRMLALAGYPLGLTFRIFDPLKETCAKQVAEGITAQYTDLSALKEFANGLDVVTYEFENIPVESLKALGSYVDVHPSTEALLTSQDRFFEKKLFEELEIPTTKYAIASDSDELAEAIATVGTPCVVKTRRDGYDGKGQKVLREKSEVTPQLLEQLSSKNVIVEELIHFDREVSQICAFDHQQKLVAYPLTENVHRDGILRHSIAPACVSNTPLAEKAREYVEKIAMRFKYVGVLTVEFFVANGELIANEIAPRVHNSGHWTMNANIASQFENHIRAVAGLGLGTTEIAGNFGMVNFIGGLPSVNQVTLPGASVHFYGKESKPGRKVGHLNLMANERSIVESMIERF